MNVMPYDLSGVSISDQAQVDKPTVGWHIGDVRHPDLFSRVWLNLSVSCFEQVGVPTKPVVAVCRLVVRPLGCHEHVRLAQNVEQCIAPDLQFLGCKRVREQVVQFARPKSGLTKPLGANQLKHPFVALAHLVLAAQSLVIRLSADAHMAASPANVQAFDELLREDLPKGFFTTRTP